MEDLPPVFTQTLYEIEQGIIAEVEARIDNDVDCILFTHTNIFNRLASLSEKIKVSNCFVIYGDYYEVAGEFHEAQSIMLKHFMKTRCLSESEKIISESFLRHFSKTKCRHHLSDYNIFYAQYDSTSNLERALMFIEDPANITLDYGLRDLVPIEVYLEGIRTLGDSPNPIEQIAETVANNFVTDIIFKILLNMRQRDIDTSFLLREVYKLTRHYTAKDIDKHLTTDIPEFPYSETTNDLKGVYWQQTDDEEFELLYVCTDGYFNIKVRVDKTLIKIYTLTEFYLENDIAEVFGLEISMCERGMKLLEMLSYNDLNISFTDNFTINEHEIRKSLDDYMNNSHRSELLDYLTLSKGAWLTEQYSVRTNFSHSLHGLLPRPWKI